MPTLIFFGIKNKMKKVSKPFKRTDRKGFWLRWSDNGQKHLKQFNTRTEAEMYRKKKYIQLNLDVYGGESLDWTVAKAEYLEKLVINGLSKYSIEETKRLMTRIENTINPQFTSDLNQKSVNGFIKSRIDAVKSKHTVNKDIARLRALLNFLKKQEYHNGKVDISLMKAPRTVKKALTTEQIRALLKACPSETWKMRILFSLVTGLRSISDLDTLQVAWIDLKRAAIDTSSQKTGKRYIDRPLPDSLMARLSEYITGLKNTDADNRLFPDKNIRNEWNRIREKAGLPKVTRQGLRVTHSTLLQKIGSIDAARMSLEHSDKRTTGEFYTDMEVVMRWKINQLPVDLWLKD